MPDNGNMDFWERVKAQIKQQNTTQDWLAKETEIPFGTLKRWLNQKTMPNADQVLRISRALNTSIEYLLSGSATSTSNQMVEFSSTEEKDFMLIPILNQTVAAGRGQELLEASTIVGMLPFLRRMLRGEAPDRACALEVRGDSMTGIQIFDGDLVVFVPGSIRGDGIYVLMVNDSLIVKRVEFDEISKKIRIMSENPRYPDRIESADGQIVQVIGKVYGWVHSHPY